MNKDHIMWGVLFLVLFGGAHWAVNSGGYSASLVWMGLAVAMLVSSFVVGKQMKNTPKGMRDVWTAATFFGVIMTFAVALRYVPVDLSWLMSLWLLLFGAAKFASGHAGGSHMSNYGGLVLVVAALFVPGFGAGWYFMAGALFLGLMDIVNGAVLK